MGNLICLQLEEIAHGEADSSGEAGIEEIPAANFAEMGRIVIPSNGACIAHIGGFSFGGFDAGFCQNAVGGPDDFENQLKELGSLANLGPTFDAGLVMKTPAVPAT